MLQDTNPPIARRSDAPAAAPREPSAARANSLRDKAADLSQSNVILIAMVAVAVGLIYWLSRPKVVEKASAETQTAELQVNAALGRLGISGKPGQKTDVEALVGAFYEQAKDRQVPQGKLACNPFEYAPTHVPVEPATPEPPVLSE